MLFNKLCVEKVIQITNKTFETCVILEKQLPESDIIPKLKLNVEEFQEKIPILQYLRSSVLKPVCN